MKHSISVRKAKQSDYEGWSGLYDGYARFYKVGMNDQIKQQLWNWIHDPEYVVECLLAVSDDDTPCGLAHVRAMPSPLRGAEIGFLDDMFIDPEMRGSGVSKKLFEALRQHGKDKGWPIIRWITADDNYRARGLYDQVAMKTMWNTYQMDV